MIDFNVSIFYELIPNSPFTKFAKMNKTVFDNIVIDVVRKENDETNPASLTDEQCEQILQKNVKEDGSILDKEKALLQYSERRSGINITSFTQNKVWFWVRQFLIFCIVLVASYWLMNKTIDPDQDIIYIDIVFWRYCFLQLSIWLIFWVISWFSYICRSNEESKDKNSFATSFLANSIIIYGIHIICQWIWYGIKCVLCFPKYLWLDWQKKETIGFFPKKPNEVFERSAEDSSDKSNALPYNRVFKLILDDEYIKYSVLLLWKSSICLALILGIFLLNISFRNNKLHDFGFTIGDSWSFDWVQDMHVSFIDLITGSHDHYKYLHELKEKVRNAKKDDIVKYYSKQIQEEEKKKDSDKEQIESIRNSIKELNDKKLLPTHMIRYGMDETSKDYDKADKANTFGNFCFNYMIWCLVTPVIPHGFYFLIYLGFWYWEIRQKSIRCSIKTDDNGIIIDAYQKNVLDDLKIQYERICQKLIWLQIPEESESGIKLSDLKSNCDKEEKNNVFLENIAAVERWIEIQNGLPVHSHKRTLVCLCDINQPVSIDCVNVISRLSNTDKFDIRVALVYDNNLKDNYKQKQDEVSQQLYNWKSKLDSLEEGFSEKYACVYSMDSQIIESRNWRLLEDSIKNTKDQPNYNLTLDRAFEKIIKDITPVMPAVVDPPKPPVDPPKLPIPVSRELITLAPRFVSITQLSPPKPQSHCITLVIFNEVDQDDFINKFNKYAGAAQKAEKRLYQIVSDSNILNDINADQSRNLPVEYRIVLIASVISQFNAGYQLKLKGIIDQILSKEHNRPLQVFVVATDIESVRNPYGSSYVNNCLDGWGRIVEDLKKQYGTNVEFTFEDKFDYPIAPQDVWTNIFCSKAFPEANIEIVELPTSEERKKKFAEAVKAIRSACDFVFDNELDDNACLNQEALLFNAIHDIYSSKGVFNLDGFVTGLTNLRKKGLDSLSKIQENLPSVDDFKIVSFFKSLINNSLEGSVSGGVLAVVAPFIGLPAVGIGGGMMLGGSIELLVKKWSKARADRRKARAEEDAAFKAKTEAEQNCILQVESLIASGLTWAIVYDGQGYPEEEITETIKQVLQPLELVHIFNKEDMETFLDTAQSRWKKRCSIN